MHDPLIILCSSSRFLVSSISHRARADPCQNGKEEGIHEGQRKNRSQKHIQSGRHIAEQKEDQSGEDADKKGAQCSHSHSLTSIKTHLNAFSNISHQIQANVKVQQESSDRQLKSLHEQMVVKKQPVQPKKINVPAKKAKKNAPKTSTVQSTLEKMTVG